MIRLLLDRLWPRLQFYKIEVENLTPQMLTCQLRRRWHSQAMLQFVVGPNSNHYWLSLPEGNIVTRRGGLRFDVFETSAPVARQWKIERGRYRDGYSLKIYIGERP